MQAHAEARSTRRKRKLLLLNLSAASASPREYSEKQISKHHRNIIAAKFEILQNPALPDAESAKPEQAIKANLRGLGRWGGRARCWRQWGDS